MERIGDLTREDLELLVEQKVLEILGDPDFGLELTDEFKEKLKKRLADSSPRISHEEVARKFGEG